MKLTSFCFRNYSLILIFIVALFFTGKTLNAQTDTAIEKSNNDDDTVHIAVEKEPKFPGGRKALFRYIKNEVNYPDEAKKEGTTGTVVVSFVVDKEGGINAPEIDRGVSELLDEEALRVVRNMPDWQPGMQRGDKVQVRMRLPIRFALNDEDDAEDGE